MQYTIFHDFSRINWKELHNQYNQKQINMKTKKKAAIKAKKRIRLNVECHSMSEKLFLITEMAKAKKKYQNFVKLK